MPRKEVDNDKLEKLAVRSYESSIDKYITKNESFIDDDVEPFVVQLYTLAKTLDEKTQRNAQTSGTLTQEFRMSFKELHGMVAKEKDRQAAAALAAELESQVDPDEQALGEYLR
ncbi:hypothetical protein CH262_12510 [Rhodococcus sp. 05-2255-1e]|uniref:hypothetical protein n=1 Tax=Rhodococcus sp. 05-2255-1e TaxID=2022495 RepID=UPI000B9A6910|nr:hypothetical protein [Rhodococcus sp. 05-2255-1e]OZE25672.1 hypothetical protein CH262_12510 [Rhodococcus sp. 05-2255-1e]